MKSLKSRGGPAQKLKDFIKKGSYSSFFILCDSNTLKYCLSEIILMCPDLKDAEIIEVEPGEASKDLQIANTIWETLTENNADKNSLFINLGGGMICDLGGFIASLYKRGIDFIHIPTTLLAMADASVGGKNGINFNNIKNHIGLIREAAEIIIVEDLLTTLPDRHILNGFAEILKIAVVSDAVLFKEIENIEITARTINFEIITRSIELKQKIVEKDPFEKNFRKVLNFGHTAGHAIESLYLYDPDCLLHGEAVAIGMAIETVLSGQLKKISKAEMERILKSISKNFRLPVIPSGKLPDFFNFVRHDKKNSAEKLNFALITALGQCDPKVSVSLAQLQKAIGYYNLNLANSAAL